MFYTKPLSLKVVQGLIRLIIIHMYGLYRALQKIKISSYVVICRFRFQIQQNLLHEQYLHMHDRDKHPQNTHRVRLCTDSLHDFRH